MSDNRPDPSKLYHRPASATWWLTKRSYFLYMVRELTSVAIAAFLIVFLVHLHALTQGMGSYVDFLEGLASPGWITFHVVVLALAVYHSITWFQTTAIVMAVRIGAKEVPRAAVVTGILIVWAVVSVILLWLSQSL